MSMLTRIGGAWVMAMVLTQAAHAAGPGRVVGRFGDFDARAEGWSRWSPREEIAPRFSVDPHGGRGGGGALRLEGGGDAASFGAWRRRVEGVAPAHVYRLVAWYRAEGVPYERRSVSARLDWLDAKGERAQAPDYALDAGREGGWTRVEHVAVAPEGARAVSIDLAFGWCPSGAVWWDDVQLLEETALPQRLVRVATIGHRPRGTHSASESVAEFCRLADAAASQKPDVLCLPEGVTLVGNGKSYAEVAEPVPGPTTRTLGDLARRLHSYVVAGLYERSGPVVYNTAVLIGRDGELVGRYRKTHLPREEAEGGLTPGDEYPVFRTDFGTVGLMICWDVQFPEPCRALGLQGAELVLLPIWGGSEVLARARAIENHVFLVSSSYDMKSFIVDPTGAVLAEATEAQPFALAQVDLDLPILQPWLGNMKPRTWKERRPDIPLP